MLNNVFRATIFDDDHVSKSSINDDTWKLYVNMEDANQEMYRRCMFTKLGVFVRFHIKCLSKFINKAVVMLLELLQELLPNEIEKLSESFYIIKKVIGDLGLSYDKIMHARVIVCFIGVRTII